MKKILLTVTIALLLSINVLPVNATAEAVSPLAISQDNTVSPLSEETVWCNRIHNGVLQKRLWSITYGKWLTEWEDVVVVG